MKSSFVTGFSGGGEDGLTVSAMTGDVGGMTGVDGGMAGVMRGLLWSGRHLTGDDGAVVELSLLSAEISMG